MFKLTSSKRKDICRTIPSQIFVCRHNSCCWITSLWQLCLIRLNIVTMLWENKVVSLNVKIPNDTAWYILRIDQVISCDRMLEIKVNFYKSNFFDKLTFLPYSISSCTKYHLDFIDWHISESFSAAMLIKINRKSVMKWNRRQNQVNMSNLCIDCLTINTGFS